MEYECADDLEAIHYYKTNPPAQDSPYWRKGCNILYQNVAIEIEGRVTQIVKTNSLDPNMRML